MAASDDYDIRPVGVDADTLSAVAGLFRMVWPKLVHLNTAYLRWLYAENPNGPVIGLNAWKHDVLAGHYVVIPIRASIHGECVPAALSLNTAVHPEHQGRGLFTTLARGTYDLARQRGVHHIVGVANANSTPGFMRKLDFHCVAPLTVRLLWRSPRIRRARKPSASAWSRIWNEADLQWRLRNPSIRYTVRYGSACRTILSPTHIPGIHAILKTDDMADCPPIANASLPAARAMRLKLWMGLSSRIEFPSLGGFELPDRLKKSPLNLIIRYLCSDTPPVKPDDVEFEAVDFDAY